jgi:hypothetical protein
MENTKYKSSVLLAIFRRKGEEGLLTKIITAENKPDYFKQMILLKEDENALLCFKEDDLNWLLLTDNRILKEETGSKLSIPFSGLTEVNPALKEEYEAGVMNKSCFTRLELIDLSGKKDVIKVEKGKPYQGVFQILDHIASKNKEFK